MKKLLKNYNIKNSSQVAALAKSGQMNGSIPLLFGFLVIHLCFSTVLNDNSAVLFDSRPGSLFACCKISSNRVA